MLDLGLLRENGDFDVSKGSIRLALVHHGFRTTQLEIADEGKSRFSPRYPSLGLLNLARSLEIDAQNGAFASVPELQYFDEESYPSDAELAQAIMDWLRPAAARFLLVGLYTLAVERTAAFLGAFDPQTFCIVVGGAHPTVAPDIDFAHIVVRGEGGGAIRHIVANLLRPGFGEGADARGVCFDLDGVRKATGPAFDRSLATIPSPAFAYGLKGAHHDESAGAKERWWKALGRTPQIYICTQSCRARCTFCSTYMIHGSLVSRPLAYVKADLDYMIREFGHDAIQFHDDDLLQHEEFDGLLDCLEERGVVWSCNARSEFITPSLARAMYRAGCRRVFLGVESFNQESLDYYRKATTVEMNKTAVRALDAAGIGVVCGYIVGAPHDTVETALADMKIMLSLPIYFLSASILTPDIGTVEFARARKENPELRMLGDGGFTTNMKPRPEIFGSAPPFGFPTVCRMMSKVELNEVYDLANCAFFLRPSTLERVWRFTADERRAEVEAWYAWMAEKAAALRSTATLPAVRDWAAELCRDEGLRPRERVLANALAATGSGSMR